MPIQEGLCAVVLVSHGGNKETEKDALRLRDKERAEKALKSLHFPDGSEFGRMTFRQAPSIEWENYCD